jgi:GTP-binding protein
MQIKEAQFVQSSPRVHQKPKDGLPEFAFIGRSNVGKSSLINMLCGRKGLAKTSQTPGKTRLVNHFRINGSWYIVDLPGYGYARMPDKGREELRRIISDYILGSEEMVLLFVLIDSRHDLGRVDLEFLDWIGENGVPFSIIFTKGDKSGPNVRAAQVEKNCQKLLESWEELPPVFVSSSETGLGKEDILNHIETVLKSLENGA